MIGLTLLARRTHQYVQPVMLAISSSATGDHEAAIVFCRQAVDGGMRCSR